MDRRAAGGLEAARRTRTALADEQIRPADLARGAAGYDRLRVRIGSNPAKAQRAACTPPERVTLVTVAWIPHLKGYFRSALDIFRFSLLSARENTDVAFDVLVVDNDSCKEVDRFLRAEQRAGNIQYVIRCDRNVGTVNATVQALRAAPGELIAFADYDVLFRERWLEELMSVQTAFPEAGIVCGVPIRNSPDAQLAVARDVFGSDGRTVVEEGSFVAGAVLEEWAASIGMSLEEYLNHPNVRNTDLRLTRGGATAYAGGGHFAYLTTADAVGRSAHPRTDKLVPKRCPGYDVQITNLGIPTLSTARPVFYHLGNCLAEEWVQTEYTRLVGRRAPRAATQPAGEARGTFPRVARAAAIVRR